MVNREHKDRLFKMIFGRPEHREWTLSLYNAVNGTDYEDPSLIRFNTLEEVLFMGMKNDLSFILDCELSIYEHQSSYNPNMPVRFLMYLGTLWSGWLYGSDDLDVYGSKLIELPVPRFVVFYNGTETDKEEVTLKLSEAFPRAVRDRSDIELRVTMLNVNSGRNVELMNKCRPLYEYSWFIAEIRKYKTTMPLEAAVEKALEGMPDDFQIKHFLRENKGAVMMSILTEYDEEKHLRLTKIQSKKEEREVLNRLNKWLCDQGRTDELFRSFSDESLQQQLILEMKGKMGEESYARV